MFSLKLRMWLLWIVMFGIIYAIVSMLSYSFFGVRNFNFYLVVSFIMMFIQYMIGPKLVEWSMRVKYVREQEYPELFQMIRGLSQLANVPMPKIGISDVSLPNAFAFGRWKRDGRICVTKGILGLLDREELRAVLGHEMTHLKNRDVLTITLLSVIPMVLYRIAWSTMYYRGSRNRSDGANTALIGVLAFIFYFITNLLVLYASRIREYFADRGSVSLGNPAHNLASALYKLVYGAARTPKESLAEVEGLKAFFINDPSVALKEIRELSVIDKDHSGSIDSLELMALRDKQVKVSAGAKLMELLSTHPNMLKRIKQLSSYERL
ncbi:MAG: zinc metalloprotease HtpX [Candidatus Omnitrophota bacterium]|nr:zinc metalloprotease HtpX [Candidatus Omnitrophota bacterium]